MSKEHNELSKLIKSLEKVINSQKALDNLVKKELLEVSEDFGDERRTEIIQDEEEAVIDAMDIIVQEDVVVTISREGFIKRMPLKNYQRVTTDESSIEFREGDELAVLLGEQYERCALHLLGFRHALSAEDHGCAGAQVEGQGRPHGQLHQGASTSTKSPSSGPSPWMDRRKEASSSSPPEGL